jgi:hypothetical protein
MAVIKTAGASRTPDKKPGSARRDAARLIAARLRAAKDDDEATDAVEALIELARINDEE